jgi:hypothetical protein
VIDPAGWNGKPVTLAALAVAFNARFHQGRHFQRYNHPRTRGAEREIGVAYARLYREFDTLLRGFTLKNGHPTSMVRWISPGKRDYIDRIDPGELDPNGNPSVGEMLKILNAMASSDRTDAVAWLHWRIDYRCLVGATAYAAEKRAKEERVAAEIAAEEERVAAKKRAKEERPAMKAMKKSAKEELKNALMALPVPITLDVLSKGISEAKAATPLNAVIGALLFSRPPTPEEEEEGWDLPWLGPESPLVTEIVELYAAYMAAKAGLR